MLGITIPYAPVWRGPQVLKQRTIVTGSCCCSQYACATHSSTALPHAYDQRSLCVGPITRSSPSENGTVIPLPYTSLLEKSRTRRLCSAQASSTTSVPRMFVIRERSGFSRTYLTPTAAAR